MCNARAEVYCRAAGTVLMCLHGAALQCAGSNEALQLGINDTSLLQGTNSSATPNGFSATPVEVPLPSPDADWHMVVCGSTACCATAATGDGPGERQGSAAVHAGPGSLAAMPVLQRIIRPERAHMVTGVPLPPHLQPTAGAVRSAAPPGGRLKRCQGVAATRATP